LGLSCKKEIPQENQDSDKPDVQMQAAETAQIQVQNTITPWTFEMAILTKDNKNTVITYADSENKRIDEYQGISERKKIESITIFTKEATYKLNPRKKIAVKSPPEKNQLSENRPPYALISWDIIANEWTNSGATVIGRKTKKWNGKDYIVYKIITPEKSSIDYYLDEERIIRRVINYDQKGELLSDTRLNLKIGPLPQGIFNIPDGYMVK